jgi:hypothetical protein
VSDPRIYHRVGPVAPEGRQIYDDIRRRDLGLTSAFNSELSSVNTTLTGEITTLEGQVNALAVTPVSVGVTSGESSTVTISSVGTTISTVTVTPVGAVPFIIKCQCWLSDPSANATLTATLKEGATTIATLFSSFPVTTFTAAVVVIMVRDVLVANSDTVARTFDLVVTSSGSVGCDYDGTNQAFQWTVG